MHVTLRYLLKYPCSTPHAALQHMRGRLEPIQGLLKGVEIKTTENAVHENTETSNRRLYTVDKLALDIQKGCYLIFFKK